MLNDRSDIAQQLSKLVQNIYDENLTVEDRKYINPNSTFVEFIEIPKEESLPEDKNLVFVRVSIIGTIASYDAAKSQAAKQHKSLEKVSRQFIDSVKGAKLRFSNGDVATFKTNPNLVNEDTVNSKYIELEYWNGWAECIGDKLPDIAILGLDMRIAA